MVDDTTTGMVGDSENGEQSRDYEGTTWVVFIDSYGADDVEKTPWMAENLDMGKMDAGPVYVTPTVLGQIYTGEPPAQNGMPAVSRYDQDPRLRPVQHTIPEFAAMDDTYENVLQFGLPFIVPPQITDPTGEYWAVSGAMQQMNFAPQQAQPFLQTAGPAGDVQYAENQEMVFNLMVDHCQTAFGTARSLAAAQNFELVFVSIRTPDSYAHYHHTDGPEDGDETWRDMLLWEIDQQVKYCSESGDVFVFGDHGARPLDEVFRVNRWLIDNGYLEVEIDHEYREKLMDDEFMQIDEKSPGETVTVGQPGVEIDEDNSVAVAADPFSTGITLLDGAGPLAVGDLIEGLKAEPVAEDVFLTADVWEGDHLDECPDIYIERKPGYFVSGNLAEEIGGVEITRSGVHDPVAAFGTNADMEIPGSTTPAGLFDIISHDYLGIDTTPPDAALGAQAVDMTDGERREMEAHLQEMGYM